MSALINIIDYPIKDALHLLLRDKTTGKNIIWATDAYSSNGYEFSDKSQITTDTLLGMNAIDLQPRIEKALEEQQERTRKKAEVFTPVWLCNKMNNYCDEQWFGRKEVFNKEMDDHQWKVVEVPIEFPQKKTWKGYVDSRRLEITCGEAPYLVSRYDAATGDLILPPMRRIGILDRKLRIVNENTNTREDWLKWAIRAFQSCYGYEYQGDSLLIARINLLMTFCDYYEERWKMQADKKLLNKIANIISWNIWQMDGLKDTVPLGKPHEEYHQISMFEMLEETVPEETALPCKIKNWRANESVIYKDLKKGK